MGYFLDNTRKARKAAGLSQTLAAEIAGVSRENYNSFENGRRPLTEDRLKVLFTALGIPERTYKAWMAIDEFGPEALIEAFHILRPEHSMQA